MERMKKTEKWQNLISWCIYCTWKKFSLRRKQNLKNCEWKMKTYTVASTAPFEFSQSLMVFFYPKKETTHQQSIPDCFISHHRKNIQVSYWRERCVPCMAEDLPIIRHATSKQELSFNCIIVIVKALQYNCKRSPNKSCRLASGTSARAYISIAIKC